MKKFFAVLLTLLMLCAMLSVPSLADDMPSEGKHILVLDTDLGTDDACALLLSLQLPQPLDYIVTSYGNTSPEGVCRNAVLLKNYLGLSAQIVHGLPMPNDPNLPLAEKNTFHSADGLANQRERLISELNLTEQAFSDMLSFEAFENLLSEVDSVTYITIGALTNLSRLLDNDMFRQKTDKIYVMGGGLTEFNCKHDTEFNFSKHPQSVQKLLKSGMDITLFPLDITNHQRLTTEDIDALETLDRHPVYIQFLRFNLVSNTEHNQIPAAVLHDAMPVLYAAYPSCFAFRDMRLVADDYGHTEVSSDGEIIHVCVEVQENLLIDKMREAFSR